MIFRSGTPEATEESGMAGIRGMGRNRKELWRWQTPLLPGLYRHKAEGNQRSDDPCQRPVYEPAEEAKASFAPLFQRLWNPIQNRQEEPTFALA